MRCGDGGEEAARAHQRHSIARDEEPDQLYLLLEPAPEAAEREGPGAHKRQEVQESAPVQVKAEGDLRPVQRERDDSGVQHEAPQVPGQ